MVHDIEVLRPRPPWYVRYAWGLVFAAGAGILGVLGWSVVYIAFEHY